MTTYADFTYYQGTYLGTKIAEADFPQLAMRASAVIDLVTYNRAAAAYTGSDTALIDKIKMATCSVAESLQSTDTAGDTDGIQSESIGRYSVTFNESSSRQKTNGDRWFQAAALYLGLTGLMFSGFTEDEQV